MSQPGVFVWDRVLGRGHSGNSFLTVEQDLEDGTLLAVIHEIMKDLIQRSSLLALLGFPRNWAVPLPCKLPLLQTWCAG